MTRSTARGRAARSGRQRPGVAPHGGDGAQPGRAPHQDRRPSTPATSSGGFRTKRRRHARSATRPASCSADGLRQAAAVRRSAWSSSRRRTAGATSPATGSRTSSRASSACRSRTKVIDAATDDRRGNSRSAAQTGDMPSAVDNMTPGNPFVRALDPAADRARHRRQLDRRRRRRSAVRRGKNDGVVEYDSAHLNDGESEIVVHSPHSCQSNPTTIAEVRRILLKHLDAGTSATPPIKTAPGPRPLQQPPDQRPET